MGAALRENGVHPTGPSPAVRRCRRAEGRADGTRGRGDSDETGPKPPLTISFEVFLFSFPFFVSGGGRVTADFADDGGLRGGAVIVRPCTCHAERWRALWRGTVVVVGARA